MKVKLKSVDYILLLLCGAGIAFVLYRLFYALNYKWNWEIIPTYLVRYDDTSGSWVPNILLEGFLTTIRLSVWGIVLAALLGLVMGLARTARRLFFRLCGRTYVEFIRNSPPLVLVFIFYYFVSDQILPATGLELFVRDLSPGAQHGLSLLAAPASLFIPFLSGVITIGIFQGAYITEIVRAGIEAIETGQWEASRAMGFNRWQQLRLIILPQALRLMLPPLANEFINTIKYSSIVSIISIQELTFQGMQVMASTQITIEIWLTITLMYLLLCLSLSLLVQYLEKRLAIH
ncbi:MAG: amino acid ABC transporter permease [Proteobacteria bacterium]|nr:MAG: amino acid ABC transporter permease [Pseudomonadota bacterium]